MQWGSIVAVFFVVWWLCFVAVLPIGAQSHHETGEATVPGADPGSPVAPRLLRKALIATGLAVVFTGLLLWALTNETLTAYWNR
jgi:predicted secreted protein